MKKDSPDKAFSKILFILFILSKNFLGRVVAKNPLRRLYLISLVFRLVFRSSSCRVQQHLNYYRYNILRDLSFFFDNFRGMKQITSWNSIKKKKKFLLILNPCSLKKKSVMKHKSLKTVSITE